MSPIDPISPTSPMDLSPISPAEAAILFSVPTTPIISPAVYLPRLRTSFHMATSDIANGRRMSLQFQLPTPSPLSLGQTSDSMICHRGNSGTSSWETSPTSASSMASAHRQPPRRGSNAVDSSSIHGRVPSLVRQNANEGFERMQSEESTSLPLRVDTSLSTPSRRRRSSATLESAATHSSKSPYNTTISSPISTRRARSPIRRTKHQRNHSNMHRRRSSRQTRSTQTSTPAPTLLIHEPPTPNTASRQTEIKSRINHLARRLVPLVSVTTGQPHPEFPTNLLRYQLLTHEQLDALAHWYHQVEDSDLQNERWNYPCPIAVGKTWCGARTSGSGSDEDQVVVDLETKRRRWGRFIGLQGCESPVGEEEEGVRELEERLEREWREALRRAREADRLREKIWRGRF